MVGVDFNQRVRLYPGKQREIVEEYISHFSTQGAASKDLGISETTLSTYKNEHSRTIPVDILSRLAEKTGQDIGDLVEDRTTFDALRANSLNNWRHENPEEARREQLKASRMGIKALKERYKDNPSEITRAAREALEEKYGPEWSKIVGSKAYEAVIGKYGKDGLRQFSRIPWEKLVAEHGEEGARKILSKRLLSGLVEKYGENWTDVVPEMARDIWRRKYPNDWRDRMIQPAREAFEETYGSSRHVGTLMLMLNNSGLLNDTVRDEIKKGVKDLVEFNPKAVEILHRMISEPKLSEILLEGELGLVDLLHLHLPETFSLVMDFADFRIEEYVPKMIKEFLEENPGSTENEIAEALGLNPSYVRRIFYKNERVFFGKRLQRELVSQWWLRKQLEQN